MSERLLEIAERGLQRAATPALVQIRHARRLLVPFGPGGPRDERIADDVRFEVVCFHDGRAGTATIHALDDAAIAGAFRLAEAAARAPGAAPHGGPPDPAQARPHHGFDAQTARLDPADAAAAAHAAVAAAAGAAVHGAVELADTTIAVASTAGARLTDRVTRAAAAATSYGASASDAAVGLDGLDAAAVAREALAATPAGETAEASPGPCPVVFAPRAVAQLLDTLGHCAFNGLAHATGSGALSGLLGRAVAAPAVNLSDAPGFSGTLPRAFDAEGVPKGTVPLIRDGVAHGVVHDSRSAALAGAASTGHALAAGGAATGPRPTNLVLVGGDGEDEAGLAHGIDRGLLVRAFADIDAVEPGTANVMGITRGASLIEDGAVTRPVRDVRIEDDALRILQATEALGSNLRLVLLQDGSAVVCPPLRAGGVPVLRI